MPEQLSIYKHWESDPEFVALPHEAKSKILGNYFDQNMADEEFMSLPEEEQITIRQNVLQSHLGTPHEGMAVQGEGEFARPPLMPSTRVSAMAQDPDILQEEIGRKFDEVLHRKKDFAAPSKAGLVDEGFLKQAGRAFGEGLSDVDLDIKGFDLAVRMAAGADVKGDLDAWATERQRRQEERAEGAELADEQGFIRKSAIEAVRMAGPMAKGAMEGIILGGVVAAAGQMGPQVLTLEEAFTFPLATAVGAGQYWYRQGFGENFGAMIDQGVSPEIAAKVALTVAPIYALIEFSQVRKIAPGLDRIVKRKVTDSITKIVTRNVGRFAGDIATEAGEEMLQETALAAGEEAGKAVSNVLDNTELEHTQLKNIWERVWGTFKASLTPMAMLLGPKRMVTATQQANARRKLEKEVKALSPEAREGIGLTDEVLKEQFDIKAPEEVEEVKEEIPEKVVPEKPKEVTKVTEPKKPKIVPPEELSADKVAFVDKYIEELGKDKSPEEALKDVTERWPEDTPEDIYARAKAEELFPAKAKKPTEAAEEKETNRDIRRVQARKGKVEELTEKLPEIKQRLIDDKYKHINDKIDDQQSAGKLFTALLQLKKAGERGGDQNAIAIADKGLNELRALGFEEVGDALLGQEFDEGLAVKARFIPGDENAAPGSIITKIVSPGIARDGKQIQVPEIEVTVGEEIAEKPPVRPIGAAEGEKAVEAPPVKAVEEKVAPAPPEEVIAPKEEVVVEEKAKVEKVMGEFDSNDPPTIDNPISAVKLSTGEIYYDKTAKIHSDVIENLNIPAEKVVEGGFITVAGTYAQGGVDAARIGRQARAQKAVEEKRKALKAKIKKVEKKPISALAVEEARKAEERAPPTEAEKKLAKAMEEEERLAVEEAKAEIEEGDWITDGLIRGRIVGEGTVGKNIPVYKIDIGGERTGVIIKTQARPMVSKEQKELAKAFEEEKKLKVKKKKAAPPEPEKRYAGFPLPEIVQEKIRKEAAKVKELLPKKKEEAFEFSSKEIEARFNLAKGVKKDPYVTRIKTNLSSFWQKLSREYEYLPKTEEFSQLRFDLLKLTKQKGVASDKALREIADITDGLDKTNYDLFTRKVILDDFSAMLEEDPDVALPFGLNKENFNDEYERLNLAIADNKTINEAIEKRNKVWESVKKDYIKATKEIGLDVEDRLKRKNYFRHQVLDYIRVKNSVSGAGRKLRTPAYRGFLKGRTGSELDINTDYLQAEHEVMAQMIYDMEIAKTIQAVDKNYNIKDDLKKEAKEKETTWDQIIPEGYVEWQPREGNVFYMADSIPARLAMQLTEGALENLGISKEDIKKVFALGGKRRSFVIKEEIAVTLDNLTKEKTASAIGDFDKKVLRAWKVWQLISPRRMFKYNFRNLTGDADAVFAGNPSTFKKISQASSELITAYSDKGELTENVRDWLDRGGTITTMQAQEMGELNRLSAFINKYERKGIKDIPSAAWHKYWKAARLTTDFRESILRYAAYLDYLEQIEKSAESKPKNYGASIPAEIDGLENPKDKAFWLSNDLLGAYDRVGVLGQHIREHIFPFWSWKEVNTKRYIRIFRNAASDRDLTTAIGRKLAGTIAKSPYTLYRIGRFAIMASAFFAFAQVWNHLRFPDEEDDLPENVKNKPHLIFGRDANGKVIYFSRIGALGDLLEWLNLDASPYYVNEMFKGRMSIKDVAKDMAKAPINILVQGAFPFIKLTGEALTRRSLFPDIFKPGTVRDRGFHIARSFGLESEYKELKRLPSRGYRETVGKFFYYRSDPLEAAYWNIQGEKRRFLAKKGKSYIGFHMTPRGNALYNLKLSFRMGDKEAVGKYLEAYFALGGTKKGIKQSVKSMNPYYGLDAKEKKEFLEYLDEEDKNQLEKAEFFYNQQLKEMRTGIKATSPPVGKERPEIKRPTGKRDAGERPVVPRPVTP